MGSSDAVPVNASHMRSVADRVREVSTPWWFAVPSVALACVKVAVAPLALVVKIAEGVVALALLGILALAGAWYQGYVSDKDVVAALKPVGQRLVSMVQGAGAN